MTRLDLEAIRARCIAATKGPWNVVSLTCPNGNTVVDSITGAGEPQWSDYGDGEGEWFTDRLTLVETDAGHYGPTMPDAQFIAHARADIPALLAYIEEVEQENVKLREEFLRLRVETGRHRKAAALSEERALTAEERLEQMTRERDEARAQLAAVDTGSPCDGHRHCCADRRRLAEELLRVRAERDALRSSLDRKIRHCDEITEERDALREIHAPSK